MGSKPFRKQHKVNSLCINLLITRLLLPPAGTEGFRVPRQAEEEGTVAKVLDTLKSYYDQGITTASGYLDSIRGMKLEEKAK